MSAISSVPSPKLIPLLGALFMALAISLIVIGALLTRAASVASKHEDSFTHAQLGALARKIEGLERTLCIDELTGLQNSRALEQRALPAALGAVEKNRIPLAVIYTDLDGLKSINDQNGHDVADAVIKDAALTIQAVLQRGRSTDQVFRRYRGDEFVTVLTGADEVTATEKAADIHEALRATGREASSGVVILPPTHKDHYTAKMLLALSDELMRKAKKAGKDRYVVEVLP